MADQWLVVDPTKRGPWAVQTQTHGTVVSGTTRYLTTHNPELVAEIKERAPQVIATRTEDQRRYGRVSFTMPALPYETEWDRKHKERYGSD